ncbi:MAG: TIM barrel protein [Hyphomicrobiales bacterium]|nr:TIM barrel protein [Hyphomicrobiales bacterium]
MSAPKLPHRAFFKLARQLGMTDVEIRNDLQGVALADGTPAADVRTAAAGEGVRIISINALQRFNQWSDARAREAAVLAAYARDCGAAALVLCPVNDTAWQPGDAARLEHLRQSLTELAPILRSHGVRGLVEPLGFIECSLRRKREALDAIDATGTGDIFALLHDTFHHVVAGETEMFPARTGLVHISGVADPAVPVSAMRDPHRVLVGKPDFIGNIAQIAALRAGGFTGPFSFEPFARQVHDLPDIAAALQASRTLIDSELHIAA